MEDKDLFVQCQKLDDRSKSNMRRIEKLENWQKDIGDIIAAVGRIDEKVDIFNKNINEKVDVLVDRLGQENEEIKERIEKTDNKVQHIIDKSGKRWDSIIEKVLLTAVSALVLYMMAKLGIS